MQATEMHQVCVQRGMNFVIFTSEMFVLELNCLETTHLLCVMFSASFRGVDGTESDLIFNIMRNGIISIYQVPSIVQWIYIPFYL